MVVDDPLLIWSIDLLSGKADSVLMDDIVVQRLSICVVWHFAKQRFTVFFPLHKNYLEGLSTRLCLGSRRRSGVVARVSDYCGQEVPGTNPTVGVRLWVSLFASITSPHPGVKGVPSQRKRYLCLCSLLR
jgi:hypothetical protein